MRESRVQNVKRNIIWGNVGNIVILLLSVISRTIFIKYLGMEYLGVNGLFSNILGLLAFSELGIGSAMNYSLYKPIAEGNTEKVKALMKLYKKAYRCVALVIAVIGISIIPFIPKLVNTTVVYDDIYIYYCIFLFNTVSSYFVTYKYAYVTALQKEYIVTNISTIANFVINTIQIVEMVIFRNFLVYLVIQSVFGLMQKIITVLYLNKKFVLLKEPANESLDAHTISEIKKNVKALIIHKIGDASIHQTDNIIISVFLNTITVGVMSNYIMVQNAIAKFTNIIFNSFTASLGNLIAKEDIGKQEEILNQYVFIGFWIYGFVTISFISLIQPLFVLWGKVVGDNMLVDNLTMVLYFLTIYFAGQCLPVVNFKMAAGIFNDDKWVALIQAVVNLIVSIVAVKFIGLPGVYIGTLVQRMVAYIWKPVIIYKKQFKKNAAYYFKKQLNYCVSVLLGCLINLFVLRVLFKNKITIYSFIGMIIVTIIVPNIVFFVLHYKDEEYRGIVSRLKKSEVAKIQN